MESNNFVQMMLDGLLDFQHRGILCDTILRAQGKEIPAHSIILAATSAKLKRELVRPDTEPGTQHIVELPDFAVNDIQCLLEYIYTGVPASHALADIDGVITLCETLEIPQPPSWTVSENDKIKAEIQTVVTIKDLIDSVLDSNNADVIDITPSNEGNILSSPAADSNKTVVYHCSTCKREFKRLAALRLHEKSHWATSADAMRKQKTPKMGKASPAKCANRNKAGETCTDNGLSAEAVGSLQHMEFVEVKKELVEPEITPHAVKRQKSTMCEKCSKTFANTSELNAHRRLEHSEADDFVYVCDCCEHRFQFASQLVDHHQTHDTTTCEICGEAFESYAKLYRHRFRHCQMKNERGELLFSCRVCARQFSSKAAVREHRIVEHLRCSLCNKFFVKPCKLRRHELSCKRRQEKLLDDGNTTAQGKTAKDENKCDDGFLCNECGKIFQTHTSLTSHKKVHVSSEYYKKVCASAQYKCATCGNAFLKLSKLQRHQPGCQMRFAKGIAKSVLDTQNAGNVENLDSTCEGAYPCTECNRVFDKQTSLTSHKKVHAPDEFKCQTCGKVFTKRYYLVNHEMSHSDMRPHKCQYCEKSFKQLSQMLRHVARKHHRGPRPHMCSECGRTFAVKSDLKDHEGVHTGEKSHMCDQCGMQFRTRGILRVHLRQHTGARPFECKFCGRRFAQLSNRLKHETIHTGICPVKCEQCGRGFADTSALKRHELFHSGLRPHACPICNRTFALKSTLNAHIQIHDSVRHHVCPVCNKAFVLRSGLLRHLKIHARRASLSGGILGEVTGIMKLPLKKVSLNKKPCDDDSDEDEVAYEPDALHAMYIAENVVDVNTEK